MTRESSLWATFKGVLPVDAHAVRVENSVEVGTPDVNLCIQYAEPPCTGQDFWIELKVQDPPKRKTTKFRCEHFTMEQRQWLAKRIQAGGKAYLLMQASNQYLFIRGDIAAVWVDHCTLAELLEKCEWTGLHLAELVEYLQR